MDFLFYMICISYCKTIDTDWPMVLKLRNSYLHDTDVHTHFVNLIKKCFGAVTTNQTTKKRSTKKAMPSLCVSSFATDLFVLTVTTFISTVFSLFVHK